MQDHTHSFGYWLRRRRKALDLTQEALATRVSCSIFSIRKVESDERRPSRRLAERLATALAIPAAEMPAFLEAARAVRGMAGLHVDAAPLGADPRPSQQASDRPSHQEGADSTPFVGRHREFEWLTGLLAPLGTGAGHIVLIEGEPGIGKSRLMRELARRASARGIATLATNCYEIERATPYQPVIDLMTHAFERTPAAALRRLAPVSLAELAALVPEVGERYPDLPRLSNDFPEARQARLSRAIAQLLEASSDARPSILMVDDIQWADDASAQVLHALARSAGQRPVLVVYAYRSENVDTDERLARLVDSLRREPNARRLLLERLAYGDTEALVVALADCGTASSGLAARLHHETEGNPFFLMSILHALQEGERGLDLSATGATGLLPDALRSAVRVRLSHVPMEFRPLLETAAVFGRRFDVDKLLAVTRQNEAQLLVALEALVKRHLLREEPQGGVYDFSHEKVREVVYRDIGGARRRLLHQAVAQAMEQRGDAEAHEHDAQLAEHFERGQVWAKALHHLVRAGERSQALFAMRDALHWLDRAVALCESHPESLPAPQRLALYGRRGAARAQAGQTEGAVADFQRVIDALRAGGERDKTRDALIQLGMAHRRADAYQEATVCLTEALAECRALNDERHAADTLYHLGTVAWSTGQNSDAIRFHQQAVDICERAGFDDLVAVQAYHGRGEAHFANAEPAAAIACYSRSLQVARRIGDKSYECENLMMIGHACVGAKGLGDYPRAGASFEAALAIARAADLQWHLGPTLLGIDHVRACTGRLGEAWTGLQRTLAWVEGLRQTRYQLIAHDFIGQLLLDLGLADLAIAQLERAQALGADTGIMFWRATIDTHLAVARTRLQRPVDVEELQLTLERTRRTSERYLSLRCLDGLAEIALAAGDAQACLAHADALLAIAVPDGLRECEAVARRWRGGAWLAQQDYRRAQAELNRAAVLAKEVGRVRLEIDVQAALAQLFGAQGERSLADQHGAMSHALSQAVGDSLLGSGIESDYRLAGLAA